jgi:hypothetical protein
MKRKRSLKFIISTTSNVCLSSPDYSEHYAEDVEGFQGVTKIDTLPKRCLLLGHG